MIDGLRGGRQEGERRDPHDRGPAEGGHEHEEGDEDVEDERNRFATEQHEPPLEAIGDGAPDEAEGEGSDTARPHEHARVDDLVLGVGVLYPENLGDEVEGLDEANQHGARQQQAEVPVAEGAERLDATVGHERRVYAVGRSRPVDP